jgi:hypothetical protein
MLAATRGSAAIRALPARSASVAASATAGSATLPYLQAAWRWAVWWFREWRKSSRLPACGHKYKT